MITFTRVNKSDKWSPIDGADGVEGFLARIIFRALQDLRDGALNQAFQDGVSKQDVERILQSLDWTAFGASMRDAGNTLGNFFQKTGLNDLKDMGVDANLVFTLINEKAVSFAAEFAAKYVVEIQDDLRQSIRAKVVSSVSGELTVAELSRQIRQGLPLHANWAKAVPKFYDKTYKRLIKDGVPQAKAVANAEAMAAKYEQKLIRKRALVIARTETQRAAQQGTYDSWLAGIDSGLIRKGSRKVWFAEPSACDLCAALKDTEISVTSDWGFSDGFNGGLMPPRHPNCRCRVALLPPKD